MSYKPILFNTEMVKAIKDGRKTQTRRIIKDFAGERITRVLKPDGSYGKYGTKGWLGMLPDRGDGNEYCIEVRPPCEPGDVLWVRERFCEPYEPGRYAYFADYDENKGITSPDGRLTLSTNIFRWKPSIHMPKGAARIFLRVKDVRVERLCQITPQDAVSEGISRLFDHMTKAEYEEWANRSGVQVPQHEQSWTNYMWHGRFGVHGMGNKISDAWPWQFSSYETPCGSFSSLWNSTVPLKEWDNYGWDANPWVWVIEFERCEKPSDFR